MFFDQAMASTGAGSYHYGSSSCSGATEPNARVDQSPETGFGPGQPMAKLDQQYQDTLERFTRTDCTSTREWWNHLCQLKELEAKAVQKAEEAMEVLVNLHQLKHAECARLSRKNQQLKDSVPEYYQEQLESIMMDDVALRQIAINLVDVAKSIKAKEL
uniref:ORF4 n=1 Tax=Piper yellow mottle virus TaxID=262957 RepID=A0A345G0A1_9VIRU|nr:ORF4 [Piper yellow mottle virus]AXG50787.1 ORF4 [Piper yellow mottle virus]